MPCRSQTRWDIENCDGAAILAALGLDWTVEITVAVQAANVINVALQVQDAEGNDLAEQKSFFAWLSDTAGAALTAATPSVGTSIGTDGVIIVEHTAEILLELLTDAVGVLDLDIEEAGVDTWYLNIRLANGAIVSSAAITFA